VLSRRLAGTPVPDSLRGKVRFADLAPADAMHALEREGARRIYVDGGKVVQAFLRAGLIEDMVITTVPVLIGAGRPLFGELEADRDLALVASRAFPSGLVQSTYRLLP
jgi:dihydrofolate reductase